MTIQQGTAGRRFPVLNQQNCRQRDKKWMPRSVAWEFAETLREQATSNHSQSLEVLASRGGLAPEEMWLAAHGHGLFKVKIDEQEAINWLVAHPRADPQPDAPPSRPFGGEE